MTFDSKESQELFFGWMANDGWRKFLQSQDKETFTDGVSVSCGEGKYTIKFEDRRKLKK